MQTLTFYITSLKLLSIITLDFQVDDIVEIVQKDVIHSRVAHIFLYRKTLIQ